MALTTEKKVGLFFLVALVALALLIEFVEEIRPFESQVEYHAYFDSLVGLNQGDPVRMAGVQVGKVRSIELEDYRIKVVFRVQEGTTVKEDSVVRVRQTNLLGGQFLGIDFGSVGKPILPPGSELPSEPTVNIDQMLTDLDRNLKIAMKDFSAFLQDGREQLAASGDRLASILTKVDEGEGTLGKLVNDPSLFDDIQLVAANVAEISRRLEAGEGALGRMLTDDELYERATAALANIQEISDRIRQGEGTLGQLLVNTEVHDRTADALGSIRDIAARINEGEGTLGRLVQDDTLYLETTEVMTRINSIAAKIDEGQGTIGRLINEDDLYRDAKTTLNKVEKTVDGLGDAGPLSALGVVLGTLF
ncbi:MlaD family protein [Geoalkalibacter halelectricus]|uniref:MlaD family protein n=1 Tax=Geoalkalibacter halelectricus TaxID=2847045 RepID=A0ABY5ZHE1_9BACT|nr:MlaD family protein [Geoalkalibacter halelectricus]MDO3379658.1 MlaD family protein [Geoalkalibacter halelectricus]UWZ78526.1 MlaD family protein [Geoalkalibacter halelectricus]